MSSEGVRLRRPLILLGAGGHAKVLLSLIHACGFEVIGVCDPALAQSGVFDWRGVRVLGSDEAVFAMDPLSVGLVNGVGQLVRTAGRRALFDAFTARGYRFPALVHPAAWVDESVSLGDGAQVMAGAIIQADVVIGSNSVINTRASVDHDCQLGRDVHVAPGATLCGGVVLADRVFVASGATVIQGLSIGEGAVVGAGVAVVRDLAAHETLLGPAARSKIAGQDH